jgi:hypothetical protein
VTDRRSRTDETTRDGWSPGSSGATRGDDDDGMIIVLSSDGAPRLTDLERLDRLHAVLHGHLDDAELDPLCRRADDDHVWLDVAAARDAGAAEADDPDFTTRYDAMIAYAERKGWLDETGRHVRAHVEPAG